VERRGSAGGYALSGPASDAGPLRFWIVDESGMPKKGKHSVGVARQYCGEVGKVDNCQVMVSLSVANEAACLPLAAQLYLPEAWAVDEERRSKAPRRRLPEQTSPRPGADPRRARRGGAARRRPGR
jgi:SRSO17 transposase